jgi:hypothetical protein
MMVGNFPDWVSLAFGDPAAQACHNTAKPGNRTEPVERGKTPSLGKARFGWDFEKGNI